MRTLNLGILAHVDAGKTTLTERLLFSSGVITELGSVDAGTTQTDSLALEQQRGITIKSAVASFSVDEVTVNLIDTPGHPDFIAEVDRALSVLDGAVLVISAVEGVQPQTRIMMRALQRLRIPTLMFVNKIDRVGADDEHVLHEIEERLTRAIVPMGSTRALGTPAARFETSTDTDPVFRQQLAEVLAERNDEIFDTYVAGSAALSYERLGAELAAQTKRALVQPVFFGSARTGAGVDALKAGIAELLPTATGDPDAPVAGSVFKVERKHDGAKLAYVRMFSGTIHQRDRVEFGRGDAQRVTTIGVFEPGGAVERPQVVAGQIARLTGLRSVRVGDRIGRGRRDDPRHQFAPPTMESLITAADPRDRARLHVALGQLAEQDPLINVRYVDSSGELSVSLYGEVQKEVIEATLSRDFGIDVAFHEVTIICIERPAGIGEALELLQDDANPFSATIGLRIEPARPSAGIDFRIDVDPRLVPTGIYKTAGAFRDRMSQYVRHTLQTGPYGWEVTDCVVTMTHCGYYVGDGPRKPTRETPRTTAADFRKLTPIVLARALRRAGTVVFEPVMRATIEMPSETVGAVIASVSRLASVVRSPSIRGSLSTIEMILPAARVPDIRSEVPSLTSGDGVLETHFAGYAPVTGAPPARH